MKTYPLARCRCALFVILVAVAQPASAQVAAATPSVTRIDTAGVLDAIAVAAVRAPGETWFVAPGDTLTARLATLAGIATTPTPTGAACPFDAPPGATVALTTALALYPIAPDTVYATLSHSCRRTRRSAVGPVFRQSERYRVVRSGGTWTAKPSGRSIT